MKTSPNISIIIPVYNAEKYLRGCLDSLLAQTYSTFEALLINDGSTDNSQNICDEYANKDSRVRVFYKVNGGVSSARNLGLKYAEGEWITFVDSDDFVSIDYLDKFEYDIYNSKDFYIQGINYCKNGIVTKSGHIDTPIVNFNDFIEYLDKRNYFEGPYGKLYKKSILVENNILFNDRLSYGEDNLFVLQYLNKIESFHISKNHGYYYVLAHSGDSLSNRVHSFDSIQDYIDMTHIERLKLANRINSNVYRLYVMKLNNTRIFNSIIGVFTNIRKYNKKEKVEKYYNLSHKINSSYGILSQSKRIITLYKCFNILKFSESLRYLFFQTIFKFRA